MASFLESLQNGGYGGGSAGLNTLYPSQAPQSISGNTNPGLRKAIADAFTEAQNGNTMTADEAGGEYAPLIRSQGQYPYMVKMLQSQGLDPSKYSGVNLGLLNTVLSYDGVNDPMKALDMIQQAGPGWTDEAGYRDGIVHALKNNLSPADAQKFTADYQSSHSAGTNAINNSIKAGLAVMTAMAGAGMAGYGPAAAGAGEAGSAVPSLGTMGTTAPSLTGGAVGAGDLALTAMPEVTAASMGLGEASAGAGSLASLGGSTGELSSLSNLGTGLSDIGYVDGTQSVLASAQPSMSMGQAMGSGTNLTGTLGGATNAAGNLIGTGAAAGGYTANFLNSPAGQLLNSLGGDSLVSMGNTVAGGLSTAQAGSTLLDNLSTGAGAIGSLITANNAGNTNANNQNAITNQMNTLSNMYSQDSPYAKMLKQQLERKDAAAGRNSQYGNRLTQLQAMLADKAAGVASTVGNLSLQSNQINNAQTANQNTQLNALGQLSNATGVTDWTRSWLNNGLNSLFGG